MSTAVPPPKCRWLDHARSRPGKHPVVPVTPDRREVVARQRQEFGGMKFGSAFFGGWRTCMAVLLTALVAGAGTALGYTTNVNTTNPTAGEVQSVGIAGGIALLAIIFLAYFCGGDVWQAEWLASTDSGKGWLSGCGR